MILYNEIDKYCARWLEHLVAANELPNGIVINKDLYLLNYDKLTDFVQCHFFCGIGGWPLALKLANWPSDESVWTGSCPCQPFSIASQNREKAGDKKHLWPDFFSLIKRYKPTTIFGEQVAGPDGIQWLSDVRIDLESIGYDFGAACLPATLVGALHERKRLFWVADSSRTRLEGFKCRREKLRKFASTSSAKRDYDCIRKRFQSISDSMSIPAFNGISRPVDIVRAFGNSLIPTLAAEFVTSFMLI